MKDLRRNLFLIYLTLVALTTTGMFCSCSDDDSSPLYHYLFAANGRDNISESEREQYAFYGWRLECLDTDDMPLNYRTCYSEFTMFDEKSGYDPSYIPSRDGLERMKASASANFSSLQFDRLLAELRQIHDGPITVVDLRSETHGTLNGIQVSRYGKQNWANIGLTQEQILENEWAEMHACQDQEVELVEISSGNNYLPVNPIVVKVTDVQTEEEACSERGVGYLRLNVLDHAFPSDQNIDRFISYASTMPDDTWLHLHGKAGNGRTTLFMALYDMMKNPLMPLRDIVYRQYMLGGEFIMYPGDEPGEQEWKIPLAQEKTEMIPLLYRYVKDNCRTNYKMKWSEWKARFANDL